jgi:hypothetical protein
MDRQNPTRWSPAAVHHHKMSRELEAKAVPVSSAAPAELWHGQSSCRSSRQWPCRQPTSAHVSPAWMSSLLTATTVCSKPPVSLASPEYAAGSIVISPEPCRSLIDGVRSPEVKLESPSSNDLGVLRQSRPAAAGHPTAPRHVFGNTKTGLDITRADNVRLLEDVEHRRHPRPAVQHATQHVRHHVHARHQNELLKANRTLRLPSGAWPRCAAW